MVSRNLRDRALGTLLSIGLAATLSLTAATATARQQASDPIPAVSSDPVAREGRCRDKSLPGSRIKERVCTPADLAAYRLTLRVRTTEVAASGGFNSYSAQR